MRTSQVTTRQQRRSESIQLRTDSPPPEPETNSTVDRVGSAPITKQNLKCVALCGAWISVLILIIFIGLLINFASINHQISATLNQVFLFLGDVRRGLNMGFSNLPPSQSTPFHTVVSQQVQMFYDINFPNLVRSFTASTVKSVFPMMADLPTTLFGIQDLLWMVQCSLRSIIPTKYTNPSDYLFPSNRNIPFTFTFQVHPELDRYCNHSHFPNVTVNGEYVDSGGVFPSFYIKEKQIARNVVVQHILNHDTNLDRDNRWRLEQNTNCLRFIGMDSTSAFDPHDLTTNQLILMDNELVTTLEQNRDDLGITYPETSRHSLGDIGDVLHLQSMTLKKRSILFNDLMHQQTIIMHREQRSGGDYVFRNGRRQVMYRLHVNDDHSINLFQPRMISPRPERWYSDDFQLHEIEVNVNGGDPVAMEWLNGIYTKLSPSNQWHSEQYPFKNVADGIQSATVFEKWNRISGHQTRLNRLTHRMKDDGKSCWELRSYQLDTLFEGQETYNLTASIETVHWKPVFPGLEPLEIDIAELPEINAKMKKFEMFGPLIHSVILDYQKKKIGSSIPDWSDPRQFHAVKLAPYARIQDVNIHFRINAPKNRVDGIVAELEPLFPTDEPRCRTHPERASDPIYLELRPLQIKSDVLGGKIHGRAHVFFRNKQACNDWLLQHKETLDRVTETSEKTARKNGIKTEAGLNELKELLWGKRYRLGLGLGVKTVASSAANNFASAATGVAQGAVSRAQAAASGVRGRIASLFGRSNRAEDEGPQGR